MAEDTARDLRGVLDRVKKAGDGEDQVNVGEILETVGQRSFGPILIVISLIAFTPLGAVPGVPTLLATLVVLIAGQILFGVRHFRLPQAILRRHMEREKFTRSLGFTRKAARAVDAILKPRLSWLFSGPYVRVAALGCILVALTVPPLEVLPFAGTVSWAAIAAFGLALVAHDGLFAIVALGFAATTPYVIWTTLF